MVQLECQKETHIQHFKLLARDAAVVELDMVVNRFCNQNRNVLCCFISLFVRSRSQIKLNQLRLPFDYIYIHICSNVK